MTAFNKFARCAALFCLLTIGSAGVGNTQPGLPRPKAVGQKSLETQIAVELITGAEGVGLRAQRWAQIFNKMNINITIRAARFDDKLGVTDRTVAGAVRRVQVIGRLDPQGKLVFADRTFTESDEKKLAAWFQELRTYGAQGTPEGQPLWGLTKLQFGAIHGALTEKLAVEVLGAELPKAIEAFSLPKEFPVRFTDGALKLIRNRTEVSTARQALKGISKGTALAALLSEQVLGFQPRRLPNGSLELAVYPLSQTEDVWPVGWPLRTGRPATAPRLYAYVEIDLKDLVLGDVFEAVAQTLAIPILIDYSGLEARKIDLSKVKVSHPSKRTTWSLALQELASKAKARPDLWIDEAGKPFLWITPMGAKRPQDRFAAESKP